MTEYPPEHARSGLDVELPGIETWPNQYSDYEITVEIPEYNAICPKTGLPDFGHLTVRYVPDARLVGRAIAGDTAGYWFGRLVGQAIFTRPKALFFNPAHLRRAHDFYEKHGGKTIIIARFMPIVRTFAPIVAGMGQMDYRRFLAFNVFGGTLWVLSMTLIGYFLGQLPGVREHIEVVIVVVVFLSILPGII